LEEELKVALNFLRRTTISTTKLAPHVIVISYSKKEEDIKPQLAIEEQLQLVFTSRPMGKGELQQPIVEEQP
jgi:hypothetical protein